MKRLTHLSGTGIFGSDDESGIRLWNRIEFRRKKGWVEVRVSPMEEGRKTEVISSRTLVVVIFIGWIMDVIIECGGADVEQIDDTATACPLSCDNGYIPLDDGNYDPCPNCRP